jgi:hypothetical protein
MKDRPDLKYNDSLRQKSRVERLKAKVQPLLTQVSNRGHGPGTEPAWISYRPGAAPCSYLKECINQLASESQLLHNIVNLVLTITN